MLLKLRCELKGTHVHCQMFMGPQEGNLGHCGSLIFRPEEYAHFTAILMLGNDICPVVLEEEKP